MPAVPPVLRPDEAESPDVWGFRDTHFDFTTGGDVIIRGNRYELSGKELPRFLPWVREVLECDVNPKDVHQPHYPTAIPEPRISPQFLNALQKILGANQIDGDGEVRLRHGHGHTQEEMYAIKYTRLGRIPDLVVYPETDEQVTALVEAAKTHDVSLIPYGGGTNVTDALRCNDSEQRTILSIDMRRLNRIRWIDRENMMACI
jgi:alkyldihydroxyacetonephosphate synthase